MIQNSFFFVELDELDEILFRIVNHEAYERATGVLLQLYNPRVDAPEEEIVSRINRVVKKGCLTGMTAANIAGEKYDISDKPIQLSVSYFFQTKLILCEYNLSSTTAFFASRQMNEILESTQNACAMQIMYASNSASAALFTKEFRHHKLPTFGGKAGRSIRAMNTAHVYGTNCYENAVVAVVFCSDCLSVYMDHNLGWQEIGVEMVVTEVNGDNVIAQIDGKPAIEIFEKYLKVKPGPYFVQNVCEFPLMMHRKGFPLARVPAAVDEDGAVYFTSDVHQGEHFRLSYADEPKLKYFSRRSVVDLQAFEPEAVYIFECGNRLRYLKRGYWEELDHYRSLVPELSFTTGYAEIFITPEGYGGDLNSALVAIGLKEVAGQNRIITKREYIESEESAVEDHEIPFVDRILTFLSSTSKELDAINKDLGRIAFTDQLTEVYNRWEMEHKIAEALAVRKNQDCEYALLFMDIDHFKNVNDTYGHDVGDMVLRGMVNLVREKLRENDVFGRWGGEEFLCLLQASKEEACEFAETIRDTIDQACFVKVRHVTISIGVTEARADDDINSFVKRADEALYQAKETGRNRVVYADES